MIREIQLKDKEQWEKLYKGYADFYKVEMNNKILQTVWNWLHDKNHEVNGVVYEVDGNIVRVNVEYAGVKGIIQAELINPITAVAFAATCMPDFMVVCALAKNRQAVFKKVE